MDYANPKTKPFLCQVDPETIPLKFERCLQNTLAAGNKSFQRDEERYELAVDC